MKKILITFIALALFGATSFAQTSWSEAAEMDNVTITPGSGTSGDPEVIPASGVDFYTDATLWSDGCPISTARVDETWAGSLVGAGGIATCGEIISSATNDACFSTGSIAPGFELTAVSGGGSAAPFEFVTLGTGFLGVPNTAVGPNTFGDHTVFTFTTPVNAVAFEMVTPLDGSADFTVEVFGASGSLGSTTFTSNGATAAFLGAIGSEDITSMTVTSTVDGTGELFTAVSFDLCETAEIVPTMGEWAIICLFMIMMIVGTVAVNQRQTTIA